MDVKEPSLHVSQKSKSVTTRAIMQSIGTIESVLNRLIMEPTDKCSHSVTFPLLLESLLEAFANLITYLVIWHYGGLAMIS